MTDFDFSQAIAQQIITHYVGNKGKEEALALSKSETLLSDETRDYLMTYFLSPFKPTNFLSFVHPVEKGMNEIFQLAKDIFAQSDLLVAHSESMAKLLYNCSTHPNIKPGEFNVVYFSDILYAGEVVNAIGLFKSEEDSAFLKMKLEDSNYLIEHDFGYYLKSIDKACIIFDIDESAGYSVLVVDHTNRSKDAQYWIDDFLQLAPRSDAYNHTKDIMHVAKNFVTKQLTSEYEVSNTDRIDLLNRTLDYFKNNDAFEKGDFEEEVFQDPGMIDSFRVYENSYRDEQGISGQTAFSISPQAVKKEGRIFKSVLKLDKNFHIYIHGDKELIQRGEEADGRKFYKIYYKEEQ